MSAANTVLQTDTIRAALQSFWSEALQVESIKDGFAIAMPVSLPDGWQMVVDLTDQTPAGVKLTDRGRTLSWLATQGQNIDTTNLTEEIATICRQSQIQQDGWELFRWLPLPLQGVDIHVFTEGLSNIAHLYYLREVTPRSQEVADITLRRVFADRKLEAQINASLVGKTEQKVSVDYLVRPGKLVAFQLLRRKGRVTAFMEQWGYRWNDLRKMNPNLMPAMLFDPAVQDIDSESQAIGQDVCELFCSYNETDRIHALLARASA